MLNRNLWNFVAERSTYLQMNLLWISRTVWFSKCTVHKSQQSGDFTYILIADFTNCHVCGLIPYCGLTTTKRLMHPKLAFTSRIDLELTSKAQNVTHEKWCHMYTDSFYTNFELAGREKRRFIVTHVQGSQDSTPTSFLP
jgi:hypothetical protein